MLASRASATSPLRLNYRSRSLRWGLRASVAFGFVFLLLLPSLGTSPVASARPAAPPALVAASVAPLRSPVRANLPTEIRPADPSLPASSVERAFGTLAPRPSLASPTWTLPAGSSSPTFPLPAPPNRASGALRPGGPASAPTDLNLSGNTTFVVSSNLTVLNVTVQDNATLYVHGASTRVTLTVLGNIRLSGDAILFVNASNLSIGESYDVEWDLELTGNARFIVAYSDVATNGHQWGAAYEGSSNVTIFDSEVGYPAGWLDTELVGSAILYVQNSWYSSDVIMFDNPFTPSVAQFGALDSAGFNVWLNFKAGTIANLSLPGLEGWRNWTFPGTALVHGVAYSVTLSNCFVLAFAVMVWQGSHLTLANSPDVVVALNIYNGTLDLAGLAQSHYGRYAITADLVDLLLLNSTVFTWNIYPFGGTVGITQSQVGEIQQFGSATTTVDRSNLTASGGYYGNQGTSPLSISNSTIVGHIVGYDGWTELANCSVNTSQDPAILATGSAVIYSLDTTLAPTDVYSTIGAGVIDEAWTVTTNVTMAGSPVVGANVSISGAMNGTLVAGGRTDPNGSFATPLTGTIVQGGTATPQNYQFTASRLDSLGEAGAESVLAVTWVTVPIQPIVAGSTPASGASDVSIRLSSVSIYFAFPMNASGTDLAVSIAPAVPIQLAWLTSETLVIGLSSPPLAWNTTYAVTVGAGAPTATGYSLAAPVVLGFTTEAAVVPSVASVTPSAGTENVSVNTSIMVVLSEPMNASRLEGAFSLSPSVSGRTSVNSDVLVWTPDEPLAWNTTYTATIATTAESTDGVPLAQPISWSFHTQAAPVSPTNPHPTTPGSTASPSVLPWIALGAVALIVVAVVVALALRQRPPRAPEPARAAPTAPARPASRPEWSEDSDPSTGAPR